MTKTTRGDQITPAQALHLFSLDRSASLKLLNHAYRKLVVKHHPDHNPGRESAAHQAMTKINAAYDVAVDYLGALRYEEIENRLDAEVQAHENFMTVFLNVANRVVDGMFTYFQYGLTNPHQRTSGTPRLRYRQALKLMYAAVARLKAIDAPNRIDSETATVFIRFAESFIDCIQIHRVLSPSSPKRERLAYNHYRDGSESLDNAIRRGFFREELSRPNELASPQSLSVSMNEFMAVLPRFRDTSWVVEPVVNLQLLDAYTNLLKISERYEPLGL